MRRWIMEAVRSALDGGERKQPTFKQATAHQQPRFVALGRPRVWLPGRTVGMDCAQKGWSGEEKEKNKPVLVPGSHSMLRSTETSFQMCCVPGYSSENLKKGKIVEGLLKMVKSRKVVYLGRAFLCPFQLESDCHVYTAKEKTQSGNLKNAGFLY